MSQPKGVTYLPPQICRMTFVGDEVQLASGDGAWHSNGGA